MVTKEDVERQRKWEKNEKPEKSNSPFEQLYYRNTTLEERAKSTIEGIQRKRNDRRNRSNQNRH